MATRPADAETVAEDDVLGLFTKTAADLWVGRRSSSWTALHAPHYSGSMMLLTLLSACHLTVPIPQGQLEEIAEEVCKIGHPGGKYIDAEVVAASPGLFGGQRSLDVAINYDPLVGKQKTMTVRLLIDSIDPCEVRTEVLSDTGPAPILLDNQVASPIVGQMVCDSLK